MHATADAIAVRRPVPPKVPCWLRQLDEAAEAIARQRDALVRNCAALRRECDALRRTEHYEHASIYYRDGRFAYLHVRKPNGGRARVYIGVDAAKIEAVAQAIERGKKLTKVSASLDELERAAAGWTDGVLLQLHRKPPALV